MMMIDDKHADDNDDDLDKEVKSGGHWAGRGRGG